LEAKIMSSQSVLSDAQWRKIEKLLPENRRDPGLITAVLYREHSGQSLSEVAEVFGITRVRLHQWTHALEADGSLARVMAALRLEPASRSVRSLSGNRPFYHRDPAMMAEISALRIGSFREALRAGRR
jgi:hypothetical protein